MSVLGIVDTVTDMRCRYSVGQVIETGLLLTADERNLLVYLQSLWIIAPNYLRQSHGFLYGLTFSPHANRFLGQQNVFFVDWRGISSPLVTHYLLCAVFVCVTSPPRLQVLSANKWQTVLLLKLSRRTFEHFFCAMGIQSNAHLLSHYAEEEGSSFLSFWQIDFSRNAGKSAISIVLPHI